jgi:hypothetical protein
MGPAVTMKITLCAGDNLSNILGLTFYVVFDLSLKSVFQCTETLANM